MQKNSKGFGFVIPEKKGTPDAYISREECAGLLDDDIVEYIVHSRGNRASAQIVRIVKRSQIEVMGQVRFAGASREARLVTGEEQMFLLDLRGEKAPIGQWAIADIVSYPTDRGEGTVRIRELLGPELLPSHDIPIAIARYGLEDRFPREALRDADSGRLLAEEGAKERNRRDMRQMPLVTIDGADAKDFDDAVLVEAPKSGPAYILYVAIADVAHFVREKTALDDSARMRATSVYLPGTVIPMLPETLSNDLCSLRPREERLAMVAEIHYDRDGNATGTRYYNAIIKTIRRLTYDQVHQWVEGDRETVRDLQEISEPLRRAGELYKLLTKKRRERGVLDFDLPESKIQVDAKSRPVAVIQAPRYESHKWVEEFMIAANQAVARTLRVSKTPTLYRVHEAPEQEGVDELNTLLKAFGLTKVIDKIHPKAFAAAIEAAAKLPAKATLHQAILRKQKQARYEPDARGHFGLALHDYTHFTSPIRRYPDLVVHRSLKRFIRSQEDAEKDNGSPSNLDALRQLGEHTSERERRAMEAERFTVKRKQCWFMKERVGQTFPARVGSVTARGLYVQIPEFAIEGFVPIDSLPGLHEYDERRLCLRKRPGHGVIAVGDEMKIIVARVSVEQNEIEFAPADKGEQAPRASEPPAFQAKRPPARKPVKRRSDR